MQKEIKLGEGIVAYTMAVYGSHTLGQSVHAAPLLPGLQFQANHLRHFDTVKLCMHRL